MIIAKSNIESSSTLIDKGKLSTKLVFFVAGFGLSSWAPLVPFAKERLHADAATLGTILLFLGLGAAIGMPIAGMLSSKLGSRIVLLLGACGLILTLPLLAVISHSIILMLVLFIFGFSIGAIDVSANIHGTEVQDLAKKPLMSSFHGFYSIGGLVGVSCATFLIAMHVSIIVVTILCSVIIALCILAAFPKLLKTRPQQTQKLLVFPKGQVIIIGLLCLTIFLAEGALLDWGAILLSQVKNVQVEIAGIGYVCFALALTVSRFFGDNLVARFGEKQILLTGMILTGLGIVLIAFTESMIFVLASIILAGLAAGNVVPVLFSLAGKQRVMEVTHAISAISTLGYLGVLLGPAMIGYVAHFVGLNTSFYVLGILTLLSICLIPFTLSGNKST